MKLIEKRNRFYQKKLDDILLKKDVLKKKESIMLKNKRKNEKIEKNEKVISTEVDMNDLFLLQEQNSEECSPPFYPPQSTQERSSEEPAPHPNADNGHAETALRTDSTYGTEDNSPMREYSIATTSHFGIAGHYGSGSPPAPPLAATPNFSGSESDNPTPPIPTPNASTLSQSAIPQSTDGSGGSGVSTSITSALSPLPHATPSQPASQPRGVPLARPLSVTTASSVAVSRAQVRAQRREQDRAARRSQGQGIEIGNEVEVEERQLIIESIHEDQDREDEDDEDDEDGDNSEEMDEEMDEEVDRGQGSDSYDESHSAYMEALLGDSNENSEHPICLDLQLLFYFHGLV